MKLNKELNFFCCICQYAFFGMLLFVTSCGAQPLSKSGAIEGCRVYNFDDGRQLALKEKNVLHLGAVMGVTKVRLFEVAMRVPEELSFSVEEISVYPITETPKSMCSIGNAESKLCRLALNDISMEARFSKVGGISDEMVLKAVRMYLWNSVCEK